MRSEQVSFFSEGKRLVGTLHLPDGEDDGLPPVIVQTPGWLELACSPTSERYHEGFVQAGFAVLGFNYRGYGGSEGERGWVRPTDNVEDALAAITYARSRPEVDGNRLGLYAVGGIGGGIAIYTAAVEPRVRCVAAQTIVADGPTWLRQMRREYEWIEFQNRVEGNRRNRVLFNRDERVEPREEIMIATPERKADASRRANDSEIGGEFHLGTVEALIRFRPLDVVDRLAPRGLLLTSVENDVVTPEDHALALYAKAGAPKRLIRQTGVKHYEAYGKNYEPIMAELVAWYRRFLVHSPLEAHAAEPSESIVTL